MVDVKICGISSPADYQLAMPLVRDGLAWSIIQDHRGILISRHWPSLADQIETLPSAGPQRVLLTVDQTLASLRTLIAAARPDFLQLHGQETIDPPSLSKLNLVCQS